LALLLPLLTSGPDLGDLKIWVFEKF